MNGGRRTDGKKNICSIGYKRKKKRDAGNDDTNRREKDWRRLKTGTAGTYARSERKDAYKSQRAGRGKKSTEGLKNSALAVLNVMANCCCRHT